MKVCFVATSLFVAISPFVTFASVSLAQPPGDEPVLPTSEAELDAAVGSMVDVALSSGDLLSGVKLNGIERNKKTNEIVALRVQHEDGGKATKLPRKAFVQVANEGKPLLPRPAAKSGSDASSSTNSEKSTTKASASPSSAKTKRTELAAKKAAAEREAWLKRLAERGIPPWPTLTPERKLHAVWQQHKFIEEVKETFPDLVRYDTGQFIFNTNLPAPQARLCVVHLDEMHKKLCEVYGVEHRGSVWLGKGLVFAFIRQAEFEAFEQKHMNGRTGGAMGLCHSFGDGRVVISCYSGRDADFFGQLMVHESSHGFLHRHKTPVNVPSWIDEGIADWIGNLIVPKAQSARLKVAQSVGRLRSTQTIDSDFFRADGNIAHSDYGIAVSMVGFLLQHDAKQFVTFIDGIKAGLTWEESLQESFGLGTQEFIASYGRSIGAPNLRIQ